MTLPELLRFAAHRAQRGLVLACSVLPSVVGHWQWTPPKWIGRLEAGTQWLMGRIRERPRQSASVVAVALILIGGGYLGWRYYQNLPKPKTIAFEVQPPERTCYECDPPGKPNPLIVQFAGSVAPLKLAGKVIDAATAGVRLSPAFAGEWRWRDDSSLVFTPKTDWPIGEHYRVSFARKGFAAPQILLDRYDLEFDSAAFGAKIESSEFFQDPVAATDKKIVVTLGFTHPVDPAYLEPLISLRLFNQIARGQDEEIKPAPHFTVTYDKLKLHGYIHSEQLSVPAKQGRVEVRVAAGIRALRGGNAFAEALTSSVQVPGLYSLRVERVNVSIVRDARDTPSQALMLSTTQSVTEPDMTSHVHAWILPAKHPDPTMQANWERFAHQQPYRWPVMQVTPDVLAQSAPVSLSYVPNEREHVELHGFAFKAEPGRELYVEVDKGLRSFGGYILADPTASVLEVPEYPKDVRIAYPGALLALSGKRKLTLFTRDVPALRVEIGRLLPDQLQHLVTQSHGEFAHPTFRNWALDEFNLTERFTKLVELPELEPGAANYQALDLSEYLAKPGANRQGIFFLNIQAYDRDGKRRLFAGGADEHTSDARLIVVTDLGLLVKQGADGSRDVFVQSIATGEPVAETTVEIIGRNGEPILTEVTDATGHVHFPDLKSFKEEREPVLFLARRGPDSSFLPINSHLQPLDVSRFDVGGVSNVVERASLSAYLFSDRGIYRPGDEIRAAAIVKTQDWRALPSGLPLRVEITDPRGVAVKRDIIKLSAAGFEEVRYRTRPAAPTGSYTVNVFAIRGDDRSDLLGSTTIKVQEFLPDRLRIGLHFSNEVVDGWVAPATLSANIGLQNLFGTPAADRRVQASMSLAPAFPAFARYPDYTFHDPQAAREGFTEPLAEQKTDTAGHATLDLNLGRFARATYRVNVLAQGFEADGGRGVTGQATQLVSNLPFLVGWKADGRLDYIAHNAPRNVELIAVNAALAHTATAGLKLKRIERRYVSMLLKQDSGIYKYESRLKEVALEERDWDVPAKGATLALDTSTPGNFSYLVADGSGQLFARFDYTVAGAANLSRSLEKNAELQITLNKHDYAPGETIEMQLQAPYTGAGLITIERDRVYAWQWFKASTTASVQRIHVPEGLEGNAYVSVSFVRDPASDEIYTSPLSYGVQPFSIALGARREPVALRAPLLMTPGQALTISYRTSRPARIALFAVDEGILQVARYKTPDPLGYFFQKRALDVSTRQILDLILPEFRSAMLSAPGGDEGSALAANLNPFKRRTDKPVAWWSGILDANTQEQTASWVVPDYFNGRLRVMAVAVDGEAIGTAEQSTTVRGDFVLSPNVPLTVTPGDEFDVSVGVANNVAGSGPNARVALSLMSSGALEIVGDSHATLAIAEMRESVAHFRVRARDALGSASLMFRAELGDHHAVIATDVSVRPVTPYITTLTTGSFRSSQSVPVTRSLYPQYRTQEASVSVLPLALAHGLTSYLGHYPYSCTEQLVSQAMPAIVLSNRPEFGELRSHEGETLAGLIDELRSRQIPDGGYRYWAGGVDSVDFVSAYAQHVLLEASERGMPVPSDLINKENGFLRTLARRDPDTLADERTTAYAIYLLARQGQMVSNEAASLVKRLEARYPKSWPTDIAAAYLAAAYRLMQQKDLADQLIARVPFSASAADDRWRPAEDRWHDSMSRDADLLYLLARHFPERLTRIPDGVLDTLVKDVQEGRYQSLSAASTILALDAYATATKANVGGQLGIAAMLADRSRRTLELPAGLFPRVEFPDQTRSLTFSNSSALRTFYLVNQSGFDRSAPTEALTQGLEITREYLGADGKPPTQVRVGDELTVNIHFRSIGRTFIPDAVMVDLLPGGFDLVIPSEAPADPLFRAVDVRADSDDNSHRNRRTRGCLCAFLIERPPDFPDFADLREDRVVVYGNATDSVRTFSYRIKATNAGTFQVPPAYGASMYDASVRARSLAGRIEVQRP